MTVLLRYRAQFALMMQNFLHTLLLMIHESSVVVLMMQFFCVHITGHHEESTVISRRRLTICCEVKVLRDSGYGSTKTMMKEKCSTFDVMEGKDGDSFCFPDQNLLRTCHACGAGPLAESHRGRGV